MVLDNRNNKTTVLATLAPMLLSLSVASLIAMSTPNYVSAQGLFEGLEREQSDEGVLGAQPADTGAAPLNDTTTAQPGDVQGSDGAVSTTMTGNATTTMGTTNATTTAGQTEGGGGAQSTSEARMHIEQARMALQNNDTQGAMMQLDLALNALGGSTEGNMTSSAANNGTTTAGGPTSSGG